MAILSNNVPNQAATLLSAIHNQATGKTAAAITDTASFVSVAQATLATGTENVVNAISTVLSDTLFRVRPYSRKFKGLEADSIKYGNHVRKINFGDSDPENDQRQGLVDGASVDQQKVKKPPVKQTNFYGFNVFQRQVTIFKDQFDVAFSNPAELQNFITSIIRSVSDQMEKDHEDMARAALCNLIGGQIANTAGQKIHLVTEYNTAMGLSGDAALTSTTVMQGENFVRFVKWAVARIGKLSDLMTERSYKFHTNFTDLNIPRHTPVERQHLYLTSGFVHDMETTVLSSVHHDNYLKLVDFESVNYWQSIDAPTTVNVTASYMKPDGTLTTGTANNANVFGILFDDEAIGYTVVNQWSAAAPFNAAGGYTNTFWHYSDRYWNDFTENSVVLLLD